MCDNSAPDWDPVGGAVLCRSSALAEPLHGLGDGRAEQLCLGCVQHHLLVQVRADEVQHDVRCLCRRALELVVPQRDPDRWEGGTARNGSTSSGSRAAAAGS